MGAGGGKHEVDASMKKRDKEINAQLNKDRHILGQTIKILLLGGPASGKSTIFKQMQILHLNGFTEAEKKNFKHLVHSNVRQCFKQMFKGAKQLQISLEPIKMTANKLIDYINMCETLPIDSIPSLDEELLETMLVVWQAPCITEVYERRNDYELLDSCAYLMDRLLEICDPLYIPSDDDVLRARAQTTGIAEINFMFKSTTLKLVDVGGQKSERRKWIHCFDDVSSILYVTDLAGYTKFITDEEVPVNMLKSSVEIFDEINKTKSLSKAQSILFMNKVDVFEEALLKTPLTICYPEYEGTSRVSDAGRFIKEQFTATISDPKKRIYPHLTTATNTENVNIVFAAAMDIVLQAVKGAAGVS